MMKWDEKRLIEAARHAAEVATNCDDEKCSQEHAELADWLEELIGWRELAPLAGAVTMLLRKCSVEEDTVGEQQRVERLIEEHYRLDTDVSDLAEDIVTALEAYDA